ncbi:unnamed protein product [Protopolystoma xenopodis]|uniref:Helicase ATP-binding domain-containing protein n=1 Tax=Protopolystoma xenopodis TaxID=117903 RepID=A0A3S5BNZ7_9PLAT|nr:unnamed protein product [Protopolystoma xenopodis]
MSDISISESYLVKNKVIAAGTPIDDGLAYDFSDKFSLIPNLDNRLLQNISRCGYDRMTSVQSHAIGILSIDSVIDIASGKELQEESSTEGINIALSENALLERKRLVGKYDMMTASHTGSGKTLAFLTPMLNRLLKAYPNESMEAIKIGRFQGQYPLALILAPTRELVQQTFSQVMKLCYSTYVRPLAVYGGEPPYRQESELARGCHLLVATPGRLLDYLERDLMRLTFCRLVQDSDHL